MNPLYRNDKQGQYPPSWYADTADIPAPRAPLTGDRHADVAVVGAGFTGLWAALTLARRGMNVVVVDAHRVGFGASGRNGGQVGSGYNPGQAWIAGKLGVDAARTLWELAEDAKTQLRDFCAAHAPEAAYTPGVAYGAYSRSEAETARVATDRMAATYGYDQAETLDEDAMRALVKTPLYKGGTLDMGAGHIHPLNYALALAREAEAAGATIFESTEVTKITPGTPATLATRQGRITADHVILAGNGYMPPGIEPQTAARVMPINSFIAATEPLPDRWQEVLARDIAVADSKFVVNYYRFTADRRFLFGGRESYSIGYPRNIDGALIARMTALFPQLTGTRITHSWGGTLGITMTRVPAVLRVAPNILSGAGFSGHGVALSGMAGRVMAEATWGQAARLDAMAALPTPRFPGGATLRAPLLTLAMTWYALRDRLGI